MPFCATAQSGWKRQPTGTFAWLHAVHFIDGERGWAVGGKGALLQTTNGGRDWKLMPAPCEDTLRDIHFADAHTGWLVAERDIYKLRTEDETRAYLLKTTDGGANWSRVEVVGKETNARLVRVRFAGSEHGWVFGEEGALFATSDGGRTWARQLVPTRHLLLGGAFRDARVGWLVGAGGTFLHTSDGGATWGAALLVAASSISTTAAQFAPSGSRAPRVNAVSFIDERRGWAVGSNGSVFSTTNGGRSWSARTTGTDADLLDVKFFDEREGFAAGAGGAVLHTTDGGVTWVLQPTDTTHQLERLHFLDRRQGWAVGFGGTILTYDAASQPK
ncbi:MAG TPA: YCF48-related protein [Pyrinomonadaceae bacterium]